MFFKRLKIAEKNASDACRKAIELEEELRKARISTKEDISCAAQYWIALRDYILSDVKCPMCGELMEFDVEVQKRYSIVFGTKVHRLKCPHDGFEIRCDSLKGCVEQLREIEEKAKKGE